MEICLKVCALVFLFIVKLRFGKKSVGSVILERYGRETLQCFRKLEKTFKQVKKQQCDLDFLTSCRLNHVTPKFLRFKLSNRRLQDSVQYKQFQIQLLDLEINHKTKCLQNSRKCYQHTAKILRSRVWWLDFQHLLSIVHRSGHNHAIHAKFIHNKKLKSLGVSTGHTIDSVWNLSSRTLSEEEHDILSKGLKYILGPRKPSFTKHFLDFEILYSRLRGHDIFEQPSSSTQTASQDFKEKYRTLIHTYYNDFKKEWKINSIDNRTERDIYILKKLSEDNSIVVTRPDKGNGVVIMNRTDYVSKMESILSDPEKFQKVDGDLGKILLKLEDKYNRILRSLKSDDKIDQGTYSKLYASGSQPGLLYGLAKVHKSEVPLRPILSSINTFNYPLAKYLVPLLTSITTNQYTVQDSFSFAKEINQLSLQDTYMASFDIKSLYTNIPLDETIDICSTLLSQSPTSLLHHHPRSLSSLLELATKNCHFLFNNSIYTQIDGLAMGSALGPSLANAFLCYHEQTWIDNCPQDFKPIFYRRYMDDTFLIFRTKDHLPKFLHYLNNQHAAIQFTYEEEAEGKIPFLDITIKREADGSFSTSIYRKPTYTGLISQFTSFGPLSYKFNLISALVHRAWGICSSYANFHSEIEYLTQLFSKNGYPDYFFFKYLSRTINKLVSPVLITTVPRADLFFSLDFHGFVSVNFKNKLTELVGKFYPQVRLHFAFRTNNRIGSFFHLKDRIPSYLRSRVVYKYKCNVCDDIYIGETMRWLGMRVCEHSGHSFRTGTPLSCPPYSAIRDHMLTHNTSVSKSSFEIIDSGNTEIDIKVLETLHSKVLKPSISRHDSSLILACFQ